jgi:lysozyme
VRINPRAVGFIAGAVLTVAGSVVADYEGNPPESYQDVVGVVSACHGHTGKDVQLGVHYSAAQCAQWFHDDLLKAAHGVEGCVHAPMTVNQEGGYTSLAYNIGITAFCRSSVARKANAGDRAGSCAAISRYVYAGGKKLRGLERRRAAERALCERAP